VDEWVNNLLNLHDKKDQMIESLYQDLLAKENALLAVKREVKHFNQEKVMCDAHDYAICDTSNLLQKLDGLGDCSNLVDANVDDVHVYLILKMILVIFLKVNLIVKMMILAVLKSIQRELSPKFKLMNKMGSDGKGLGKNMQGIQNPIKICIIPRNEGLGYEGQTSNDDIKFVKAETSTDKELSTSNIAMKQEQMQEQSCIQLW